jgi:hypothetical protein
MNFAKAIQMGYALVVVFEFWEYNVTCLNKDTGCGGLFAGCVDMFLKHKQESSGYPAWIQTEDDKDR